MHHKARQKIPVRAEGLPGAELKLTSHLWWAHHLSPDTNPRTLKIGGQPSAATGVEEEDSPRGHTRSIATRPKLNKQGAL